MSIIETFKLVWGYFWGLFPVFPVGLCCNLTTSLTTPSAPSFSLSDVKLGVDFESLDGPNEL